MQQDPERSPSLPVAVSPNNFVAWAEHLADRLRWGYFALIVVLYLVGYSTSWRMQPDSAFYLEIGRNISRGLGFTYHGEPNHLAYPGLPKLLALVHAWFPRDAIAVANGMLLLIALVTLAATYHLMKRVVGRPKAVIVVFFLAGSAAFLKQSYAPLTDMPFYLGVAACLLGFECAGVLIVPAMAKTAGRGDRIGGWLLIAGGFALAALMRPMILPFSAVIVLAALLSAWRRKAGWLTWLVIGLMLVVALVVIATDPRRATGGLDRYETQVLRSVSDVPVWVRGVLRPNLLEFVHDVLPGTFFGFSFGMVGDILATLVLALLTLQLARTRVTWMLWVFAVWLTMIGVMPQDRYLLPVLPMLILAWWQGLEWVSGRVAGRRGDVLAVGLYLLLWPAIGRGWVAVWFEQTRSPLIEYYREGRHKATVQVADLLRQHTPPDATIVADGRFARILSYLTERRVISEWREVAKDVPREKIYGLVESEEAYPRARFRRWRAVPDAARTWVIKVPTRGGIITQQLFGLTAAPRTTRPATRPAPASLPAAAVRGQADADAQR